MKTKKLWSSQARVWKALDASYYKMGGLFITPSPLTDAESRYSNNERELLAACWSLTTVNHYIYGKNMRLETDHEPSESIWKKSISSTASLKLQRLLLRMAKYDVDKIHTQ